MLKKLLKYDIKNIFKGLLVFYILSLFFAILTRLFLMIDNSFIMNVIARICSGTTIAMIFNIIINNLIRSWVRFKENLYGDQSYLTHTLPVKKSEIYLSKFISSIVSMFISVIVILVTLIIAFYSKENLEFIKNLIMPLATVYESTVIKIILAFIFICFLELTNMLESGYAGIILGHKRNSLKTVYSFAFGFGVYLCTQIIAILGVFIVALFDKDLMNLFYTMDAINVPTVKLCIMIAIVVYSINIIWLYVFNLIRFKKGVNVE